MKILRIGLMLGIAAALAGCTTSSKVQEMIDASQQDFLRKSEDNANSITVLKKTAKDSLEKDTEHARIINDLKAQLAASEAALASLQETVEAAKVLTANSMVKTSELKGEVDANRSTMESHIEKMQSIDELYAKVLIAHFQMVSDSANAAIATLEADNRPDVELGPIERDPILIDEPIEIIAPETSTPTNTLESDG